ncbi:MAG: triose-phosphate isomerase [Candidatus Nomurabacteria bacterium]|nr:triose-phosphate isomerase [Candidatus Nomurabacteria bacterium]
MLLIANWKMNFSPVEAVRNFKKFSKLAPQKTSLVIAVPQIALANIAEAKASSQTPLQVAAQNFNFHPNGAYTGEVGIEQINGLADYALIGHSERRIYAYETDKDCARKVAAALSVKIHPILCVGETAHDRDRGQAELVVRAQVAAGLAGVASNRLAEVVVAYEPVWAISGFGSAKIAKPADAAKMLAVVRDEIKVLFGGEKSKQVQILYGGSVNPDNAATYVLKSKADGLLVGNASLNVYSFRDILDKMELLR